MAFGADPTGKTDATAAVQAAVSAMLNTTRIAPAPMASGIANLGGAVLDLAGGEFLISAPVMIPPFLGNVRVSGGGTLRASSSFPPSKYVI